MTPTMRDWLFAGIYLAPCRFAKAEAFVSGVEPHLPLDDVVPVGVATDMLRRAAASLDGDGGCADDVTAARQLTAAQLRELADAPLMLASSGTEHAVIAAAGPLRDRLTAAGVDVAAMTVTVGSVFPEPYAASERASISLGASQAARHQLEPGVYLRLSRLRPFLSITQAARGLVHAAAAAGPDGSDRGLEQGLAEVLGLCYAAATVVPRTVLRSILIHDRHRAASSWPGVRSGHLRQAALLYREFGIAGLAALVSGGRLRIAEAEVAILTGRHRELDLPRGPGDEVTTWLLDHLCGGLLPSYLVSPLDLVLLDAVQDGASVADVCAAAGVPVSVGTARLERLSGSAALFALSGGVVASSILPRYREAEQQSGQPVLRWLAG
ncbi:hypothetical protein ONA91_27930 [Micromonospora sp. DR5-3]|uniref:hypothetical protein n=1 Tax=unclassified Micromonospora TaxID=2617518 RepID=UPI0011D7FF4E|nr:MULTISPECIES: hypothetical protein [unclassified Micromonospora]MCW3818286.1 hypothetical protein [Micromonospora sp. DR5-3]TYC21161.1 hypothetical protein FXF52_27325 [Micromonospora sp. MP36]